MLIAADPLKCLPLLLPIFRKLEIRSSPLWKMFADQDKVGQLEERNVQRMGELHTEVGAEGGEGLYMAT
jgi:hypothetical protein